jgi:cytochrome c-type biogenesis protein CcmH/NrfG
MHKQPPKESEAPTGWTSREAYMLAVICLLVGLALGYLLRGGSSPVGSVSAAAASTPINNPKPTAADVEVTAAPLKLALSADPKNYELLVQLGNLYYDKQEYAPAIDYYGRALQVRPNEVNVRTDLGTAYWYSGSPQQAVTEYEKSLQVDPGHAQTLFNMGVVYKDGLREPAKAAASWEKLLKLHPDHPDRQRILGMIEAAKKQIS